MGDGERKTTAPAPDADYPLIPEGENWISYRRRRPVAAALLCLMTSVLGGGFVGCGQGMGVADAALAGGFAGLFFGLIGAVLSGPAIWQAGPSRAIVYIYFPAWGVAVLLSLLLGVIDDGLGLAFGFFGAVTVWFLACILCLKQAGVWRRRWRRGQGLCEECEYPLRGLSVNVCPECGRPFRLREEGAPT